MFTGITGTCPGRFMFTSEQKARVFDTNEHYQSSLMFTGITGTCPDFFITIFEEEV